MPVSFSQRPAKSVVFVATIRPSGPPPAHRIEAGDDVKLFAEKIEVFVKVSAVVGLGSFSGRIQGVNNHGALPLPELAAGAEVTFSEQQVFTCSKRQ